MQQKTPIENAVATYCADWPTVRAHQPGFTVVNPETLGSGTSPDFRFQYIDISSVANGRIDWQTVQSVRFADSPSRARRVLRPGDVMLCTVRPLLGSHASADWTEENGRICSTGFAVVRPDGQLNPRYLKHLPFCEQITRQLVAWQCGTNYPAVNERDIRMLRIPIPSPDEQVGIARILDAVDTSIERMREAVKRAKELGKAVLQQFFYSALGETAYADRPARRVPKGWGLLATEALLATEPKNGVSPKAVTQPPGIPTFSIAAIRDGRVNLEEAENLKYAQIPEKVAKEFRVRRGDVLIVRGNANPDLVGKAGMIDRFPAGCIYPDIAKRVVFNDRGQQCVSSGYAVLAWNHAIVHNQVLRRAKTSNGTLKINNRDVKQIIMPVPPPEEQTEIVGLVAGITRKIDAAVDVVRAYEQLKRSLMHELLTGKVRVNHLDPKTVLRP